MENKVKAIHVTDVTEDIQRKYGIASIYNPQTKKEYLIGSRDTYIVEGIWCRGQSDKFYTQVLEDTPFMRRSHAIATYADGMMWIVGGFGVGGVALGDVWRSKFGYKWDNKKNTGNCLPFAPYLFTGWESGTFLTAFCWDGKYYIMRDYSDIISSIDGISWTVATLPPAVQKLYRFPEQPKPKRKSYTPPGDKQIELLKSHLNSIISVKQDLYLVKLNWQNINRSWWLNRKCKEDEFLYTLIDNRVLIRLQSYENYNIVSAINTAYHGSDLQAIILCSLGEFNDKTDDLTDEDKKLFRQHFKNLHTEKYKYIRDMFARGNQNYVRSRDVQRFLFCRQLFTMAPIPGYDLYDYSRIEVSDTFRIMFEQSVLKKALDKDLISYCSQFV